MAGGASRSTARNRRQRARCASTTSPDQRAVQLSFAKTRSRDWTMGRRVRAMDRNVARTRSVGHPARDAQNPHRPHTREPGRQQLALLSRRLLVSALQPVVWMAPSVVERDGRGPDRIERPVVPPFTAKEAAQFGAQKVKVARTVAAACEQASTERQIHLLQKRREARVAVQAAEDRVDL
jgi:hypothetical protein